MKRWDSTLGEKIEDKAIDAFLDEICAICRKHNMALGHEDGHGAFQVSRGVDEDDLDWLRAAHRLRPP
jgi:hypothetical protein